MLHHAHEDFQGGHQEITRTHEKLRTELYGPGMYADVQHFVKECVDCASGKEAPPNAGPSPGKIEPRYPFEAVSMNFVTHMPESAKGNTFLLTFSGYVMCKPIPATTAQDVAEAYEEQVFQRFGACSMIRHDQDPRFMSEVFIRFRELLGSRQRATLGYRPQANGQQERSLQTVIRSVRAYVAEIDQSDWDDHAERLMFALNVSFDIGYPFYLVHGWDARNTVSAMLGPKPSSVPERSAYEWRRKQQREYSYPLARAEDLQKEAQKMSSNEQTRKWLELSERVKAGLEKGDSVWLYVPKVQTGLSWKLAHMIDEIRDDFRVRLKISRLKPRVVFPKRPTVEVDVADDDDFDAVLLPEDGWEPDSSNDVFEVESIEDVRWVKRTRTARRSREYLVKWKGYDGPEWIPVT
ncbi:LOW QUALITY PROTEIN: reverse transcriptase [Phytophthora megakarya]|uniref:Reverse transcriptase n=1 Tax=Phytophthora megakarya TaxID=4795 RepID=A0A225VFD6_9STRA|nr:LOW QUALITY PROTEIN: reverse transcriptase [Phytophthora megakarya]